MNKNINITTFLSTNEFTIQKDKTKSPLFTIEFTENSEPLINSIQLIGSTISDDYKSITFKATSVQSLKKFQSKKENVTYENALRLIVSLIDQLNYLIKKEFSCFYEYTPENIIVVDGTKFIYLSNNDLIKIEKSSANIRFTRPFSREGFISPEISQITSIPTEVNYKTIYYSLGVLVVYFLLNVNINRTNTKTPNTTNISILEKENELKLNEILTPIYGTKLYWLLIRCLDNDPEKRSILYI
jgi:hypothetical protein